MGLKTGRVRIALFLAAVLFQLGIFDVKKFAVNADDAEDSKDGAKDSKGEDADDKKDEEDEAEKTEDAEDKKDADAAGEAEGDCLGVYYREYCPEEKPCCLYNKGSYMCQAAKEEGENCTQNAFAYNTGDCFCKQGLYCVDNKCTSTRPPKQAEEVY